MKKASLITDLIYSEDKPVISVLFETDNTKEIRIAMRKNTAMKEHKTPFSIVVEVFEGEIDFGVQGNINPLKKGDIIAIEGSVPHDLLAKKDSIIRLTLTKKDQVKRVENLVK